MIDMPDLVGISHGCQQYQVSSAINMFEINTTYTASTPNHIVCPSKYIHKPRFRLFPKSNILISGSVCPSPTRPTQGQPCNFQLLGGQDCHYPDSGCCGRCTKTFSCVADNSTTGNGLWQTSSACPADCCGAEGK